MVHGVAESDMTEQLHFLSFNSILTIICSSHNKLILKIKKIKKINPWPSITTGYVFVLKLVEIVRILKTKKANTQIKLCVKGLVNYKRMLFTSYHQRLKAGYLRNGKEGVL